MSLEHSPARSHTARTVAEFADRILRIPETERLTSMTRMQLWRMEQDGHFPKRFKINPAAGPKGAAGHSYAEVMAWMEERRASRNPEAA